MSRFFLRLGILASAMASMAGCDGVLQLPGLGGGATGPSARTVFPPLTSFSQTDIRSTATLPFSTTARDAEPDAVADLPPQSMAYVGDDLFYIAASWPRDDRDQTAARAAEGQLAKPCSENRNPPPQFSSGCEAIQFGLQDSLNVYVQNFVGALQRMGPGPGYNAIVAKLRAGGFVEGRTLRVGVSRCGRGFWPDEAIGAEMLEFIQAAHTANEASTSRLFQVAVLLPKALAYHYMTRLRLNAPPMSLGSASCMESMPPATLQLLADAWFDFAASANNSSTPQIPNPYLADNASVARDFYRR
ncbi:MAG: hypothetical protein U1A27_00475 [Phycisphaerae bacterium]